MFLERLVFFERSAREGNLLLASGSFRTWVGAGLAIFGLAALLATAVPWRPPPEGADAAMTDGQALPQPPPPRGGERRLRDTLSSARNWGGWTLAAISAVPRRLLALWLLLLLLLAVLILVWGFRRTGLARLLLRAVAWLIGPLLRMWRRVWRALKGVFVRTDSEPVTDLPSEAGLSADPLFDVFDHAEALSGMPPREVVIHTYHLLLNYAEMLGISRRPGHTPFEYAHVLAGAAPESSESIHTLTWAYAGAMYGGDAATIPDPSSVRETWTRIRGRLIAGMSPEELDLRRRAYLAAGSTATLS
jgi:hypothetical protein